MANSSPVFLDSEVLRLIESNQIFPTDNVNSIVRRLLKIDKTPHGWFAQGVFLPNGTKIRMGYGDDPALNGEIKDGSWFVRNKKFNSPSTAATAFVMRTRGRKNARVNGWHYWHVKPPGASDWALLDSLRVRASAGAAPVNAGASAGASNVLPIGKRAGTAGATGRAS